MMTIFFTIIFIAELIITFWIISQINRGIKWAQETNKTILESKNTINSTLSELQNEINSVRLNIEKFSGMVEKKKEDFIQIFSKDLITNLGFLVLNTNVKSMLTFIDVILTIRKFLKKK